MPSPNHSDQQQADTETIRNDNNEDITGHMISTYLHKIQLSDLIKKNKKLLHTSIVAAGFSCMESIRFMKSNN